MALAGVRWLFAALLLLQPLTALAQSRDIVSSGGAERRVALVIGNANYDTAPLANPLNDARAIAERLGALGFDVLLRENVKQRQIGAILKEFRARLSPGAEAVFFYAGHGLQVKGVNYLPTVDADISSEEDVPTQSFDVSKILELMEDSKTRLNLVFLDACRNNPFKRSFRDSSGGLAKLTPPSGTILSYATRPGSVASDGTGKNGLYTEHLLNAMAQPGVPIEQSLKAVYASVRRASQGKQEPWQEGNIEGEFFFLPKGSATAGPQAAITPIPAAPQIDPELMACQAIQQSRSAEAFEQYLSHYPKGICAPFAQIQLAALRPSVPVAPPPTPAPQQPPASEGTAAGPAGPFDGQWTMVRDCMGRQGRVQRANDLTIRNSAFSFEAGEKGTPGYQQYQGKVDPDGRLTGTCTGLSSAAGATTIGVPIECSYSLRLTRNGGEAKAEYYPAGSPNDSKRISCDVTFVRKY